MAPERQVTHGVDAVEIAAFAERAAESPEGVRRGLSVRSSCEGTCAHSLATNDSYVLGGETIERDTAFVEAAGFSVTDGRENTQYAFTTERASNACEKYGVESVTLGATR